MNASDNQTLLADLVKSALAKGADAADALLADSASVAIGRRLDKPERLERSEEMDLGIRVFIGQRQAMVSCSDRRQATLDAAIDRALSMARIVPEDPYAALAETEELAKSWADLDLDDPVEPAVETLIDRARAAEEAALAVPGITNSDGVDASWGRSQVTLVTSKGFSAQYSRSRHSFSVSVIAESDSGMERDYDYSSVIHQEDLDDPVILGRNAGERTVRRLNPRKVDTGKVPIVFDPRVASGLIGALAGALSGPSIARGTSFLKDAMGTAVFAPGITIIDDPFIKRGARSRPFDGEGIAPTRRAIIENGRLTTWFLDLRSAKQLGLKSTGHAARGTGGPPHPSPSNLYLEAGKLSPADLMGDIKSGFYVTEMMGMGVNQVTGDYSRGASGFWIENGQLIYPVSEVTIAGHLKTMFQQISAANDLTFRYGVDSPTLRIEEMTVAGL